MFCDCPDGEQLTHPIKSRCEPTGRTILTPEGVFMEISQEDDSFMDHF